MRLNILHVKKGTLEKFGAVSEEVAREMAIGCKMVAKTDIAVSVTGTAGPDGGTETQPVGTVCFGLASDFGVQSITHHFEGDRNQIRYKSCEVAMNLIMSAVLRYD